MTPEYIRFAENIKKIAPDATITIATNPNRWLTTVEVSWPCNGMRRAVREGYDMRSLSEVLFDYEHLVYQRLLHRVRTAVLEDMQLVTDKD